MNNQVQFGLLWCRVFPDFVVQIGIFSLILFSAIIHRRGKKMISKTTKHKLENSSKMQFAFFYPKNTENIF